MARPFGPRALVARVRAAVRAAREPAAVPHAAGRLRLEPQRHRATLDGTEIALTGTEFDVLSCLVRSAGRTVPRDRLRQAVWGENGGPNGRTVNVYIAQLRAKLGPGHGIRTVRGIGYVMDPEPPPPDPADPRAATRPALRPGGRTGPLRAPATIVAQGIRSEGTT